MAVFRAGASGTATRLINRTQPLPTGASLRLIGVSDQLKTLNSRGGLCSWRVWHRGKWHATFDSLVERFPRGGRLHIQPYYDCKILLYYTIILHYCTTFDS